MFRGVTTLAVDTKGRMAIPSRYRERLKDNEDGEMVITRDHRDCLFLYPLSEWEVVEAKLQGFSSFDPNAQAIRALYMNNASDVKLDSGGRILIPSELRECLSLGKKVVLSGQSNKFEIWAEDVWKAQANKSLETVRNIDWNNTSDELKNFSM